MHPIGLDWASNITRPNPMTHAHRHVGFHARAQRTQSRVFIGAREARRLTFFGNEAVDLRIRSLSMACPQIRPQAEQGDTDQDQGSHAGTYFVGSGQGIWPASNNWMN